MRDKSDLGRSHLQPDHTHTHRVTCYLSLGNRDGGTVESGRLNISGTQEIDPEGHLVLYILTLHSPVGRRHIREIGYIYSFGI